MNILKVKKDQIATFQALGNIPRALERLQRSPTVY